VEKGRMRKNFKVRKTVL